MTAKNHRSPSAPPSNSLSDSWGTAKARLAGHAARAGLKRSRARDAVVDAFLATPGHVSVEELTAIVRRRRPEVGYTTVYRALKLLSECGLAAARQFGDGKARFERVLEEAHHDHLICTSCGAIHEFEDPHIEELQEAVAQRHGFQITSHKMELYGTCIRCAAPRPPGRKSRLRAGDQARLEAASQAQR